MAMEYNPKEFVKVFRKLINWEWYTDTNTKALFIHCLLRANWKAGEWHGVHYDAGEFITSLPTMAEETGLSIQNVRTSLSHLISTGELTSSSTDSLTGKKLSKCRIITVNNWNSYQGANRQSNSELTGKLTANQQRANRQLTADKEYKEYKEDKENNKNVSPDTETLNRIVSAWNGAGGVKVRGVNPGTKRESAYLCLLSEFTEKEILCAIDNIKSSDYLAGQNDRGWKIDFDWFLNPDNFMKVYEGRYGKAKERHEQKEKAEWQEA